jgi:V/A-type H+-transporting ATPase subunit I
MFRAEPLIELRLWILASEAQDVALLLARFGAFSPAPAAPDALPDVPGKAYAEVWDEARTRCAKLVELCGAPTADATPLAADVAPTLDDLVALNAWLKTVWSACLACHEGQAVIEQERARLAELEATLAKLEHLNVDLDSLLRPDGLLAADIGSLPAGSVKRVGEALNMTGFVIARFAQSGDQVFAVVAGPRPRHGEARGVLAQAGWRELSVPAALRTHPGAARAWLEEERRRLEARAGATCSRLDALRGEFAPRLEAARRQLALAQPLAEAARVARGKGGLAALVGWVPERDVAALRARLDARFPGRYAFDARRPSAGEARGVPTLVRDPPWLAPFRPLVEGYGTPRYGEFDPLLPFSLLYLLLFGAMFGDVGHGGALVLLAILLMPRIGRLAWIGVAAGLVSMLFGLLYGSVFGYEDILAPVWVSPLADPFRLLGIATGLGVGFLLLTLVINVGNQLLAGQFARALFDANGVAGIAFYLAVLALLGGMAGVVGQTWAVPAAAAAALAIIVAYKSVSGEGSPGERVLVAAIELLESAIGLFSNTLSFMRVAAFSFNHVALTMAIFTLASGLSAAAHGITLVLGNSVIVVLEGGVVAIQALRLVYYEGFARFFNADGKPFTPLRLAETI